MQHATMGALQRPVTPFTTTLRPLATSVPPAPTTERMHTMLPPPPVSETAHSIFQHRPSPTGVVKAIILSYEMDKSADQPYKPEPDTTFREALTHLKREGYILIHGGKITAMCECVYHLLTWDDGITYPIQWDEVVELLECNYPSPPPPKENDNYDTLPCSAPKPTPTPGLGMYCCLGYGADLDYIHPDQWQAITFPRGVSHQTIYCGDLMIDDQLADVWWSLPLSCYLAQFIPQEELLRRFPYMAP